MVAPAEIWPEIVVVAVTKVIVGAENATVGVALVTVSVEVVLAGEKLAFPAKLYMIV